jgi:hypothetical protein
MLPLPFPDDAFPRRPQPPTPVMDADVRIARMLGQRLVREHGEATRQLAVVVQNRVLVLSGAVPSSSAARRVGDSALRRSSRRAGAADPLLATTGKGLMRKVTVADLIHTVRQIRDLRGLPARSRPDTDMVAAEHEGRWQRRGVDVQFHHRPPSRRPPPTMRRTHLAVDSRAMAPPGEPTTALPGRTNVLEVARQAIDRHQDHVRPRSRSMRPWPRARRYSAVVA